MEERKKRGGGGGGGGGAARPSLLFWVKKEEIKEERKAGRARKTKPSRLSSRSGSATEWFQELEPVLRQIRKATKKAFFICGQKICGNEFLI